MSAPSTPGLSVELLLRLIDVKYSCFTFTLSDVGEIFELLLEEYPGPCRLTMTLAVYGLS